MKKIITIEEHFDTPQAAQLFNENVGVGQNPKPTYEKLIDFENRLRYMDANGIDMQILSNAGNSPQVLPGNLAISACKDINDTLSEIVKLHPTRFAGLATLPVDNPEASVEELKRSITDLGLKGALISGTVNGQFLDDPKFLPIFAEAEKLDVPLYLHPGYPTNEQRDLLYTSEAYPKISSMLISTFAWGWHMDQGLQMVRLIFSGIFDKFPELKIISGHWGEFVPNFIERLDSISQIPGVGLKKPFSAYYRKNVYISPSGMFTKPQFDLAIAEIGVDHILYSEDYPYLIKEGEVRSFLDQMSISPEDKEKIAYKNAEKLFKL